MIREITANGDFVVPYINGHCRDPQLPSYRTEGIRAAVKKRSGEIALEKYGPVNLLAPVCPTSPEFQRRIQETCRKLVAMGVNGIYLDQIDQLSPMSCFDATHGHELGKGDYWTGGYRSMLGKIMEEHAGKIFLATDGTLGEVVANVFGRSSETPGGAASGLAVRAYGKEQSKNEFYGSGLLLSGDRFNGPAGDYRLQQALRAWRDRFSGRRPAGGALSADRGRRLLWNGRARGEPGDDLCDRLAAAMVGDDESADRIVSGPDRIYRVPVPADTGVDAGTIL